MNILSFDIEEWFHILDKSDSNDKAAWKSFPSRIDNNVNRILNILDEYELKATFFCLGWIGEKYPDVIKAISNHGHEIGTHSYDHKLVYQQTPIDFNNDLKLSIDVLSNLIGKEITSYRAPGFSITKNEKWAFEAMIENNIKIDTSIFPAKRAHGGFEEFESCEPSIIKTNSGEIKVFPMNTHSLFGFNFVYSGGGYFRFIPYKIIKGLTKKSDYVMTYFHPRDFDDSQPMVPNLSVFRKFKSYYGLKGAEKKLRSYLDDFDFVSLGQADKEIRWESAPNFDLSG